MAWAEQSSDTIIPTFASTLVDVRVRASCATVTGHINCNVQLYSIASDSGALYKGSRPWFTIDSLVPDNHVQTKFPIDISSCPTTFSTGSAAQLCGSLCLLPEAITTDLTLQGQRWYRYRIRTLGIPDILCHGKSVSSVVCSKFKSIQLTTPIYDIWSASFHLCCMFICECLNHLAIFQREFLSRPLFKQCHLIMFDMPGSHRRHGLQFLFRPSSALLSIGNLSAFSEYLTKQEWRGATLRNPLQLSSKITNAEALWLQESL